MVEFLLEVRLILVQLLVIILSGRMLRRMSCGPLGAVTPKERKFPCFISGNGHLWSILGVINPLVTLVLHFSTALMNYISVFQLIALN